MLMVRTRSQTLTSKNRLSTMIITNQNLITRTMKTCRRTTKRSLWECKTLTAHTPFCQQTTFSQRISMRIVSTRMERTMCHLRRKRKTIRTRKRRARGKNSRNGILMRMTLRFRMLNCWKSMHRCQELTWLIKMRTRRMKRTMKWYLWMRMANRLTVKLLLWWWTGMT